MVVQLCWQLCSAGASGACGKEVSLSTSRGPGKPPGAAFRTQWDAGRIEQWGGMLKFLEMGACHSLEGDAEVLGHEFFKIPCLISSAADTLGDFSWPFFDLF